jgi:OOP family OmpA-OmpF porin
MKSAQALSTIIFLCMFISMPALAAEIITAQDITEEVIVAEQLVRLTDNAILMLDTSGSMNEEYKDTQRSRLAILTGELKRRNAYVPELGYNFGLFIYTPWKPIYEVQPYETEGVAKALDMLPGLGSGPTRLSRGLDALAPVLRTLSGKTVVFLFTDGQYEGERRPSAVARTLARDFGVCFYVISIANDETTRAIIDGVARVNECSRVIPFDYFIDRPEYTTGALFEVRATETVITRTESKIVGLEIDPLHFAFDSADLNAAATFELDEVADFLGANAGSYVVINGYTDSSGADEYNLNLSRRRTESAAGYLTKSRGIERNRIVLDWYGPLNPVAPNDTTEGRVKNRRLEMAVGGL